MTATEIETGKYNYDRSVMKSHGRNVRSLNLHESAYVYVLVA